MNRRRPQPIHRHERCRGGASKFLVVVESCDAHLRVSRRLRAAAIVASGNKSDNGASVRGNSPWDAYHRAARSFLASIKSATLAR
jgi:hypothetical protein